MQTQFTASVSVSPYEVSLVALMDHVLLVSYITFDFYSLSSLSFLLGFLIFKGRD